VILRLAVLPRFGTCTIIARLLRDGWRSTADLIYVDFLLPDTGEGLSSPSFDPGAGQSQPTINYSRGDESVKTELPGYVRVVRPGENQNKHGNHKNRH
jgi:hypothetical protein